MAHNANIYFTLNGKLVNDDHVIATCPNVRFHVRVLGGKGGFGSMLRAIGARIEKTTNHEACRDLSGRRMRDVNNEKQIAEWLQSQDEKEKERLKKREERCERILNPKTTYEDVEYTASLQGNAQNIEDALRAAKKTSVGTKRKTTPKKSDRYKNKKSRMWTGVDDLTDSSGESSAGEEVNPLVEEVGPVVEKVDVITEESTTETTVKEAVGTNNQEQSVENTTINASTEEDHGSKENGEVDRDDSSTNTSTNEQKVDEKSHHEPVDLSTYKTADQLQALGLELLKNELKRLGLKCGGTLQQRAKRLFDAKNTSEQQRDSSS